MPDNNKDMKRLRELEYNVYKKDMKNADKYAATDFLHEKGSGCASTTFFTVAMLIMIVVFISFLIGGGGGSSAFTCAAPGCSSKAKGGSNYCWLHSPSYSENRSSGSDTDSAKSDKKSEREAGNESKEERTDYGKIWDGASDGDEGGAASADND